MIEKINSDSMVYISIDQDVELMTFSEMNRIVTQRKSQDVTVQVGDATEPKQIRRNPIIPIEIQ